MSAAKRTAARGPREPDWVCALGAFAPTVLGGLAEVEAAAVADDDHVRRAYLGI